MDHNKLLEQYKYQISASVRRDFPNVPNDIDDLIQEGLVGFSDALKNVKQEDLNKCFPYCYQMAKWRCLDFLRRSKIREEKLCILEGHHQQIDNCDPQNNIIVLSLLESALKNCTSRNRQLLLEEYFGIKSKHRCGLSENSKRRIKKHYKNQILMRAY